MMANGRIKDMAGNNEGAPGWSCGLTHDAICPFSTWTTATLRDGCISEANDNIPFRSVTRKKSVFVEWSGGFLNIMPTGMETVIMLFALRNLKGIWPMQEIRPSRCHSHTFTDCHQKSAPLGHEHRPSCVQ
jgi:hypothetical protein